MLAQMSIMNGVAFYTNTYIRMIWMFYYPFTNNVCHPQKIIQIYGEELSMAGMVGAANLILEHHIPLNPWWTWKMSKLSSVQTVTRFRSNRWILFRPDLLHQTVNCASFRNKWQILCTLLGTIRLMGLIAIAFWALIFPCNAIRIGVVIIVLAVPCIVVRWKKRRKIG